MKRISLALVLAVSVVLILVIAQNTAPIPARFLWFSAEIPGIILLILTTVGGYILGLLVAIYTGRTKAARPNAAAAGKKRESA